jgi:hypothetical protein
LPRQFAIKPDPIEAEQFDGSGEHVKALSDWVKAYNPAWHITSRNVENEELFEFLQDDSLKSVEDNVLSIFAPGEILSVRVGDWLVRTEKGEWRVLTNIMMTLKYDEIKDKK